MSVAEMSPARRRQGELGQFLTPLPVAGFMASLFEPLPPVVRLLDAGAGAGALTAAVVAILSNQHPAVREVNATVYELDPQIQDQLSVTLHQCQGLAAEAGIRFTFAIHEADFIQEMSARLADDWFSAKAPAFDAAIVNPPYRKIGTDSAERQGLRSVGIETSNLYSGFVALIQRLLVAGGQLVGITPRSFCNGPYFRSFREDFFSAMELRRLHVFESRHAAFRDDGVLQENIIFHAVKGHRQPRDLVISTSSGEQGAVVTETRLSFTEVVHPDDPAKFIHIPVGPAHTAAKEVMGALRSTLSSLGLTVSTGRVVDFRLKHALRPEPAKGTAPLLYPSHFNGGTVHWPDPEGRKPNSILDNEETRPWLVPSGLYVLTKRFTSKEERRRVVACLFDPRHVKAEWVGFENHLNYFHAAGHGLGRSLALGLFAFLNSTVVDQYFRSFSGHTQVNAADLRKLAYPDLATLRAMGAELKTPTVALAQDGIDQLVTKHLHGRR
jgi:adenine-specific DNA-methyltransferase